MVEDCVEAYGREEGVSAAVRGRQGMHHRRGLQPRVSTPRVSARLISSAQGNERSRWPGASGSIELAKRLRPDPAGCTGISWLSALESGKLAFVNWGLSLSPLIDETAGDQLVCDAVDSGNMEVVRWLVDGKGYADGDAAQVTSARRRVAGAG